MGLCYIISLTIKSIFIEGLRIFLRQIKTFMKKIIFSLCVAAVSVSASAQINKNLKFSLGGELGALTGNLNQVYSIAAGASAQADIAIDKDAAITLNAGIVEFIGKKINSSVKNRSIATIPLLVGVKYYFTPVVYGSGQLGTTVFTNSGGGSRFTYIPGIGFKLDKNIDILVKYTGLSDAGGIFGARVAYVF